MTAIDSSELLSVVQTVAIIVALLMTVYFSRRQMEAFSIDLEMRVLNDLAEKFHRIGEILIDRPELVRSVYQTPDAVTADVPFNYYILSFCAHIFHMRERKILQDNEWTGWLQWMRNAFQYGEVGRNWTEAQMERWFDPSFRAFVSRELIGIVPKPPASGSAAPPAEN